MFDCPCCSHRLLRQIHHQKVDWFCPRCRTYMPVFPQVRFHQHQILPNNKEE